MSVGTALRSAGTYESRMWSSLFRWVFRRHSYGGPGSFGYVRQVAPLIWTFILVSAIEIPAFHFLVPWPTVRIVIDVLGVWGLLWMIGLLASMYVHPHQVLPAGVAVRHGMSLDVVVPWDSIESIRPVTRLKTGRGTVQVEGETVHIVLAGQTSVDLQLRHPVVLDLPKGPTTVTAVRFWADDAPALVGAVRAELEERQNTPAE
ncbi:hypothetical protein GIS00_07825 [Nakamurella sp. YIM 132087]|uniref:PH domain-containing protein n=1 Tax=Nakamurella alba TaxID=2665158 RepID=A0A7K1FIC6_9ACTN|nr:hypothetical protein [Nakamurella alba]MTD13848.1 hypothetical protein [Nakamurella alba]